jgi:hypothetical protein
MADAVSQVGGSSGSRPRLFPTCLRAHTREPAYYQLGPEVRAAVRGEMMPYARVPCDGEPRIGKVDACP